MLSQFWAESEIGDGWENWQVVECAKQIDLTLNELCACYNISTITLNSCWTNNHWPSHIVLHFELLRQFVTGKPRVVVPFEVLTLAQKIP